MQHFANHSEENYLKTLYRLENTQVKKLNNIALSKALNLSPATVLQMVRKMADRNLVKVLEDKTIELTEEGRSAALKVIRKHRLWEVFLVSNLKFKWNEVHEIAEQLEHIESDQLIEKLDAYLDFPSVDPHGDPIPDKNGKVKPVKLRPLTEAPFNKKLAITALGDSSDAFLSYLDKLKINIGDDVEVTGIENFDKSVTIVHKEKVVVLSKEAAFHLLVRIP